jgi:acyl carrier protein
LSRDYVGQALAASRATQIEHENQPMAFLDIQSVTDQMKHDAITKRLQDIFLDVMDVDVTLSPELSAKDVPEWDSLAHVRLIITIERNFKIKFAAAEVNALKNVGDLIALIERHLSRP